MIYKLVSSKYIINKVFRDLKFTISQHTDNITDWIEYIGEALEGIGSTGALEDKNKVLTIKNNRAEIPCDLYLVKQVAYNNKPLPWGSQTFDYSIHCDDCVVVDNLGTNYSYIIRNGWLQTNLPDDEKVCIFYQGFATDDDGFPLVPENYSFRQAIYWYVIMKLMEGGFEHPNKEITYSKAESNWFKYCSQAEAEGKLFDIPRAESFMRQWLRMTPNINRADSFFTNLNEPEEVITRYRPIY